MSIAKRAFSNYKVVCWCAECQVALIKCSKCRGCLSGAGHTCGILKTLSGHFKKNKLVILYHRVHGACTEAEAIVLYKRENKINLMSRDILLR